MKKLLSVVLLAASLVAVHAQSIVTYTINMTGGNVVPPDPSTGQGSGFAYFDTIANTIAFDVTFFGLTSPSTVAVLHDGGPTVNGGVIAVIPVSPANSTFGTVSTTAITFPTAYLADLQAGKTYLDIHVSSTPGAYPGGEIRGQLLAVPEPTTLSLAGIGLGALALARARRKK